MILVFLFLAHGWYPLECCHERDCHPIPCEQIEENANGVEWGGMTFSGSQIYTTKDAQCHVCHGIANFPDGSVRPAFPHCIFVRPSV